MDIKEIILALCIAALTVIMLVFYSKCRKRFSKILFGFLSGVIVLYPVQMVVSAVGGMLSVNLFTLSVSAVLGIPGVVLLGVSAFL